MRDAAEGESDCGESGCRVDEFIIRRITAFSRNRKRCAECRVQSADADCRLPSQDARGVRSEKIYGEDEGRRMERKEEKSKERGMGSERGARGEREGGERGGKGAREGSGKGG